MSDYFELYDLILESNGNRNSDSKISTMLAINAEVNRLKKQISAANIKFKKAKKDKNFFKMKISIMQMEHAVRRMQACLNDFESCTNVADRKIINIVKSFLQKIVSALISIPVDHVVDKTYSQGARQSFENIETSKQKFQADLASNILARSDIKTFKSTVTNHYKALGSEYLNLAKNDPKAVVTTVGGSVVVDKTTDKIMSKLFTDVDNDLNNAIKILDKAKKSLDRMERQKHAQD